MISLRNNLLFKSCRHLSNAATLETETNSKWKYKLDPAVETQLQENVYKPRHHPGIEKSKLITIPNAFIKAAEITLADQNIPKAKIIDESSIFVRHLANKNPPMEQDELKNTMSKLTAKVVNRLKRTKVNLLNDKYVIKSQINDELKKKVYNWKAEDYNIFNCLLYLVGRSASDYSVLFKIFSEIKSRDPNWKPKSLFDFGSGVGTATWAAYSHWSTNILEYFNVDSSSDMNELAEHLLKGGNSQKQTFIRNVYYRQFLPATPRPYDLVVSAFTLMELPSLKNRLETLSNLWQKTSNYLVLVENGTNAGFKLINEARDFILSSNRGHVFSPCPHDDNCPRFKLDDGTPCNFEIRYHDIPFKGKGEFKKARYSYVVFKKGPKNEEDPSWPRLIRPTLLRHKHCVCNLCTKDGQIEQSIFTASKYGKFAYRCAKATEWGDRLPMNLKDGCQIIDENVDNQNVND